MTWITMAARRAAATGLEFLAGLLGFWALIFAGLARWIRP